MLYCIYSLLAIYIYIYIGHSPTESLELTAMARSEY